MNIIIDNIKKTVIFIGRIVDGKMNPLATGFLIKINGINHLVTAKHVILDENGKLADDDLSFFFNKKNSKVGWLNISKLKDIPVNWVFHRTKTVDISMIPIVDKMKNEDITLIPEGVFLASKNLVETDEVVFLSYQPGTEIKNKVDPIIRHGMVSRFNDDGTFYIDGFAFPGNSGGPVFQKPLVTKTTKNDVTEFPKLIGIIGAYLPYQERAISVQTRRTRIIFEDNTGLSIVWPIEKIFEMMKRKQCIEQINKLI